MSDEIYEGSDVTPTVEVSVWRHGELVHKQLCESEEQAASVVDAWEELEGVRCEVGDLTSRHRSAGADELELEPGDEDYPEAAEQFEPRSQSYD